MNNDLIPPPLPTSRFVSFRQRNGTAAKMAAVLILLLLLLIPLEMVHSLLGERLQRRSQAISEITSTWGNEQELVGPILMVPYKQKIRVVRDQVINGRTEKVTTLEPIVAQAYFLPAEQKIIGTLDPSLLHRGIYETVVYGAALTFAGTFTVPVFDDWKVLPEDVLWNDAVILFMATDLRGTKESLTMKLGERTFPMTPGSKLPDFPIGVQARLSNFKFSGESIPFEMKITLNGSRGLRLAPLGMQNETHITSSWADPSFQGAYLPTERKVGPEGFSAIWKASYYGRGYPQQWTSEDGKTAFNLATLRASTFGVDLITAMDTYRYVERSIKYGVLFIILVFTAFFLFEILSGIRIHPFQYTLVGVAICLFYLSLLSLSEIFSFGNAYLTGAMAATLMISLYSARILKSKGRALTMAAGLAGVYGFLYVILREQDYSLIFGTIGLFAAVAIVMFATRNIDWYARDEK